jgi:predicted kinase
MVYVSSDAIREEVFGDANDQTHNAKVFEIMKQRTLQALRGNKDVFYDATNLSAKRRIAFLKNLEGIENLRKVCVVNVVPVHVAWERNSSRERKVPLEVINRMAKQFETPHESEGWDEIIVHNEFYQPLVLHDVIVSLCSELHENPHHSLTIGNHMVAAGTSLVNVGAPDYLILAGFYHDCGKGFCKTYTNMKGEVTPIAHYYSHENVGAYLYLTYCYKDSTDLYIANLIQHHMDFFKGEKYLQKIADRFGEEFMRDLTLLHEADINAH